MRATMRRAAGKLADAVREMNEAQRLMLVLHNAPDRYVADPGAAPDTYDEFLAAHQGRCCTSPPPAGGTGGPGKDRTAGRACNARVCHVLSNWKVHDRGAFMGDVAGDLTALELL